MATLGQTLIDRGDINLIQLNLALDFRVFYGGRIGTNLLELGIIDEETLTQALAQHLGVPPVGVSELENVAYDVLKKVPREVAYRSQAIPFRTVGPHLYVAIADPRNARAVREVRDAVSEKVLLHVAPELRIQMALERHYQIRMDPRMRTLASKVVTRHHERPPVPFQGSRPQAPGPSDHKEWLSDEDVSLSNIRLKPAADREKVVLSVQKISLMLEEAKSRDEIADLALEFAQKYLKRVALFVLRKEIGYGWDARGENISRDQIKSVMIPLSEPSIFHTVVESQGHFLGAVPETPINNHFLEALGGGRPRNVLLLPLTIGGITFGAIYGDNGDNGFIDDGVNELQVMICRANIAFEKLIIAERQRALRLHERI